MEKRIFFSAYSGIFEALLRHQNS